jgi:hypothetical protein
LSIVSKRKHYFFASPPSLTLKIPCPYYNYGIKLHCSLSSLWCKKSHSKRTMGRPGCMRKMWETPALKGRCPGPLCRGCRWELQRRGVGFPRSRVGGVLFPHLWLQPQARADYGRAGRPIRGKDKIREDGHYVKPPHTFPVPDHGHSDPHLLQGRQDRQPRQRLCSKRRYRGTPHVPGREHLTGLAAAGCFYSCFFFRINSGLFRKTFMSGGTDSVSHTFPPITERAPMTVSPPSMVALA